jgi:hypothetical protein
MLVPIDKETGKKKEKLTAAEKKDMAERKEAKATADKARAKK